MKRHKIDLTIVREVLFAWSPQFVALFVTGFLLGQVDTNSWADLSAVSWVKDSHVPATVVLCVLLVGTVVTILFGTFAFFLALIRDDPERESRPTDPVKRARRSRPATRLTFISVIICVVWLFAVFLPGISDHLLRPFSEELQHYVHDIFALTIFVIFATVDLLLWSASELDEDQTEADLSRDSLFFIDLPVVLGLALIFLLQRHMRHDFFLASAPVGASGTDGVALQAFADGLSVGALGMHLTFSQLIFGILNTRKIFANHEKRLGKISMNLSERKERAAQSRWASIAALVGVGVVVVVGLFALMRRAPVTITIQGEDSSNLNAFEELQKEHPFDPRIEIKFVKDPFEPALEKANQDLVSGAGKFDVVLQYNTALALYASKNLVYDLAETRALVPNVDTAPLDDGGIFSEAWHEIGYYRLRGTSEEKAIGYPFAANTMLLVYKKTLFDDPGLRDEYRKKFAEELEPPRDWTRFRRIAEFFTMPSRHLSGVALEGAAGPWIYYEWSNFAFGMGGGVMNKTRGWEGDASTPLIIDSEATARATAYYLSLKPFNATNDYLGTDATAQREIMRAGHTAMAIMWSDFLYDLVGDDPGRTPFGFAPIPGNRSMLAGGVFYLNRHSAHPRETAEYILHLLKRPNQIELMKKGLCSALKSAYDDPEVQRRIPYAAALRDSLDRGVYMAEAGLEATAVQNIISDGLQRAWRGEAQVPAVLTEMRSAIEAKRAGIYGQAASH